MLELFGPRIRGRHAEIRIDALPTITADARLLAVVFENLISNALKYGSRDQPRIAIGVVRERTRWRFHVTSAGSAIRPKDVDGIFEPFERIPGERRARGAGLGLAICKRIVERHDGQIGVTPQPGCGNAFWFALPG